MDGKRILFVGLGNLGSAVFDQFVYVSGKHRFLVSGRNLDYMKQRTNLSVFAANQLDNYPDVAYAYVDLWNVEQTAHTISQFKPNIIFCAATLLHWSALNALPKLLSKKLYQAQLGPWLPVHLTLVYKLMQAVKQTGLTIKVINATCPDIVHPVLNKVALAPTTGIGDCANNIPALKQSIAIKLNKPLEQIKIFLVAQHHVSYWMSRRGNSDGAPFHLTVLVDGKNLTHLLDMETVFNLLPTQFKRAPGQLMTAASATAVFQGIANNIDTFTHVPGPNGLPGGYPVRVNGQGVTIQLPESLTLDQAIRINTESQRLDGIEKIDDDGTVYFAEKQMSILKETFGYECKCMLLSDVADWATELQTKYLEFAKKHTE